MRILVSNDDGVEAAGIRALAEALSEVGEVTVCAPDREQSASSHSISLHRPLRIEEVAPWAAPGPAPWAAPGAAPGPASGGAIRRFAVDGTPTDAVYLGVNHLLTEAPPQLIVSGINRGANLANDIHYSGTVAAAMEGTTLGIPSFAISLVGRAPFDYAHAARFARELARQVIQHGLPPGTLLNVNVPQGEPTGVAITSTGRRSYAATVVRKVDPRGRAYYWIGGDEQAHEHVPGSDCDAVFDRREISVTPLHLDLTQRDLVEELRRWELPARSPAPVP